MRLGITGNTNKTAIWDPLAEVIKRFVEQKRDFCVDEVLVQGLITRNLLDAETSENISVSDLASVCDMILSFGGDGSILNTAHEIGDRAIPILGINLGRLGFLAHVEYQDFFASIEKLDAGDYFTEDRIALELEVPGDPSEKSTWALNEFTVQRQGDTGLLSIGVHVDGIFLNTYWADGLVVATPTGSTAYSLALGGPIMAPGCGSVLITPMAPHSLTVRPIVIPESSVISLSMEDSGNPYILTADGVEIDLNGHDQPINIKRANHVVRLVQLMGQNIFAPLRNKLMWGK